MHKKYGSATFFSVFMILIILIIMIPAYKYYLANETVNNNDEIMRNSIQRASNTYLVYVYDGLKSESKNQQAILNENGFKDILNKMSDNILVDAGYELEDGYIETSSEDISTKKYTKDDLVITNFKSTIIEDTVSLLKVKYTYDLKVPFKLLGQTINHLEFKKEHYLLIAKK